MKKSKITDGEIHLRTGGADGTTKRFNRNLAILAREMVPAELLIEFHLAILQGHNPHFVKDARCSSGWRVTWPERGELVPTLGEKSASVTFLRQAGWGMPAQAHYVEADVRSRQGELDVDLTALQGDPGTVFALVQALRGALAAPREASPDSDASEGSLELPEGVVIDVQVGDSEI